MVEFALVLPLLLLLAFGIIEFGLLLYDKAIVTNASREGARAGVVFRADSSGNYFPFTGGEITTVVNNYASTYLVTFGPGTLTTTPTPCASRGSNLTVTVSYPYTYLVFSNLANLIGSGFPGTTTLSAQTQMRCE